MGLDVFTAPTATYFKAFFTRDFPYSTSDTGVMDADITRALTEAGFKINPAFFGSQEKYSYGYLLLAAHCMVMNLRASAQGIAGSYSWLEASKGVGSVSQGFSIPDQILQHPVLGMLSKTTYGAQYLEFVLPLMAGQIFTVEGTTQP